MFEFIHFTTVATTRPIEVWFNSPLLPNLHHKRHIIQTKTARQNNEQIFKKTAVYKITYL